MAEQSDILRRVRLLMDKAESTPFEEERNACIQKAQALMLRHAIDEAMIRHDPRAEREVPIVKHIPYTEGKGYHQAKVDLLAAVARNNRCKVVFYTKSQSSSNKTRYADIIGFADDVAWVEMMYTSLWLQLMDAGIKAHARLEPEWDWRKDDYVLPHRKTFIAAFAEGFIAEVSTRMWQANKQTMAEAEAQTTGSELALIDRKAQVDNFYDGLYPNLKNMGRSRNKGNEAGYSSGREAGRRANIGQSGLSRGAKALPRS
jgi:Protein of unknown function (DUF2786)